MTEVRGTDDLKSFNQTWAPHSGSPKVFPKQLAVVINSELERALTYATHFDLCDIFDMVEEEYDDAKCTCGLANLKQYARKLAPFRYDTNGNLLPQYEPIMDGKPPLPVDGNT